jgi:hypothetical protein
MANLSKRHEIQEHQGGTGSYLQEKVHIQQHIMCSAFSQIKPGFSQHRFPIFTNLDVMAIITKCFSEK